MSAWEVQGASHARGASGEIVASPRTSELLRMIRTQKQAHRSIGSDPIFQQYTLEIRQREQNLRRRGWKPGERPQVDEDLSAEAHSRLMLLIAAAAKARDTDARGVWARFGKPYSALGQIAEVRGGVQPAGRCCKALCRCTHAWVTAVRARVRR
jgi:hypothetical protein